MNPQDLRHDNLTDKQIERLKEYHADEVAEYGEDIENDFDVWLSNQDMMSIDYILEDYYEE